MGRYANFNTGFGYKFVFGLQSSADIMTFGGRILEYDECHDDEFRSVYMMHEWSQQDKEYIFDKFWRRISSSVIRKI